MKKNNTDVLEQKRAKQEKNSKQQKWMDEDEVLDIRLLNKKYT